MLSRCHYRDLSHQCHCYVSEYLTLTLWVFLCRSPQPTPELKPRPEMNVQNFPLANITKPHDVTFDETIRHARHGVDDVTADVVSVTKVLKATMPVERRLALQRWEERLVREMGREKFNEMQKTTLARGERLHAAIQVDFSASDLSCFLTATISS